MPKFFFHQFSDGSPIARDLVGVELANGDEAIQRAIDLIPCLLAKHLAHRDLSNGESKRRGSSVAHLSLEICNDDEALSLVRGKVIVERTTRG